MYIMNDEFLYKNNCSVIVFNDFNFNTLSDEDLDLIEKNSTELKYKKNEIIIKQGAFSTNVVYLHKGLVKLKMDGNIKPLILKIASSHSIIGLTSLTDKYNTYPFSVIAYEDSIVKLINTDTLKTLIKQNTNFANKIIDCLNLSLLQLYGRFYSFENSQSFGRLAKLLICLAKNVYKSEEFKLSFSRNELAELTGLTTESVIRTLKKFKEDKLIEDNNKVIKIINSEGLEKLCLM